MWKMNKDFNKAADYRESHKSRNDFQKCVKPRLQNCLCFLRVLIANFFENLVTIASIFLLSIALLCHIIKGIGGHK